MPLEQVRCTRRIPQAPDIVWRALKNFDVSWHPLVKSCTLSRDAAGSLLRTLETTDGQHLVERRTYASDTDRIMSYTAVSGIEGLVSYNAMIEVSATSRIIWSADISAIEGRAAAIAEGTRLVFESALDQLEHGLPEPEQESGLAYGTSGTRRTHIDGTPGLSVLTGEEPCPADGMLVLFLHGIGGQASNWSDQIKAFGARHRVAAMDLRGYGNSAPGRSQTGIDDYCNDILRVARHFDAERLVLVGLSMGSWIATSFAMRHCDKLAGLVLAGGCTGMSEADPTEREAFLKAREEPLSQGRTPADFADDVVEVIAGPDAGMEVCAALHKSMSEIPAETYRDALNCFCNPEEVFDFSKIHCPVLMVTGEHDRLAPPHEIRNVSRRIHEDSKGATDVRFEIISNAGHVCNLEQPAAFNAHLGRFLNRLNPDHPERLPAG